MIERNVRGDIPLAQESEFGMDLVLFAKGDVLHLVQQLTPALNSKNLQCKTQLDAVGGT